MKTHNEAGSTLDRRAVAPEEVSLWEPGSAQADPRLGPRALALTAIAVIVAGCVALSALFVAVGRDWTPGALAAGGVAPSRTVTITLSEFKIALSEYVLPAGKITLKISNKGTIQHELVIFKTDLSVSQLPMMSGDLNEDSSFLQDVSDGDNLNPGQSVTRAANLKPGNYILVCNLPGHMMAGMIQTVTVR